MHVLVVLDILTINASEWGCTIYRRKYHRGKKRHLSFIILYQFCTYCKLFKCRGSIYCIEIQSAIFKTFFYNNPIVQVQMGPMFHTQVYFTSKWKYNFPKELSLFLEHTHTSLTFQSHWKFLLVFHFQLEFSQPNTLYSWYSRVGSWVIEGTRSPREVVRAIYAYALSRHFFLMNTTSELESQFAPIIINIHLGPHSEGWLLQRQTGRLVQRNINVRVV